MSTTADSTSVKDALFAIVQGLPDDVTWDEVQYRIYVRQQVELGLADSRAGRLIDSDEMRRRLHEKRMTQSGE